MKTWALLFCCCLPLKHLSLTSPFGYRVHPITGQYRFHHGIDLSAHHDTVFAVFGGTASVGYNDYLGVFVAVSDSNLTCFYGHLSIPLVGRGPVLCGQPIAITGATGQVTGEHLHLAVTYQGRPIDPLRFLYELTQKQIIMSTNFKPLTDQVAEKLIAQIKEGTSIFQRDDRPLLMPYNPGSGKNYREAAALVLLMQNRPDPRWMSLKNANFNKWPVLKDEKGTLISFYKTSEMQQVPGEDGKPKMESVKLKDSVLATAFLFNGAQLRDIPAYEPKDPSVATDRARLILENAKPGSKLQEKDFASEPAYLAAALKEMAAGKVAEKAGESHIVDALKTNLAAVFISAGLGLPYDIGDDVGYLNSWSQLVREKPAELFKAANDAQKVADHVIRFEKREQEQAASTSLDKGDVIAYKGDSIKVLEILRGKTAQVENSDGAKFKVGPKDGLYAALLHAKNNPQQQQAVVHEMKPQQEQNYAIAR